MVHKERWISWAREKIGGVPTNGIVAAAVRANSNSWHALQFHLEIVDVVVLREEGQDVRQVVEALRGRGVDVPFQATWVVT